MGVDGGWLRARQARQLADADIVIAVSDTLAATWRAAGASVSVVPNGVDFDHFESSDLEPLAGRCPAGSARRGLHRSLVGSHRHRPPGAIGRHWQLRAPRRSTTANVLLAPDGGPARPTERPVGGAGPFERLPTTCAPSMSGSSPMPTVRSTVAAFPLKTLEYLAAGRPTVATDLPAIRWLDTRCRHHRGGSDDFAAKVKALSASPPTRRPSGRGGRSPPATAGTCGRQEFAEILGLHPGAVSQARPPSDRSTPGQGMTQTQPTRMNREASNPPRTSPPSCCALVVLIFAVPSMLVFQPLGAGATPAALMGTVLFLWWASGASSGTTSWRNVSGHARSTGRWRSSQRRSCSATGPATSRPGPRWRPAQPTVRCCSSLAWAGVALDRGGRPGRRESVDRVLHALVVGAAAMSAVGMLQFFLGLDIARFVSIPGLTPRSDLAFIQETIDLQACRRARRATRSSSA